MARISCLHHPAAAPRIPLTANVGRAHRRLAKRAASRERSGRSWSSGQWRTSRMRWLAILAFVTVICLGSLLAQSEVTVPGPGGGVETAQYNAAPGPTAYFLVFLAATGLVIRHLRRIAPQ